VRVATHSATSYPFILRTCLGGQRHKPGRVDGNLYAIKKHLVDGRRCRTAFPFCEGVCMTFGVETHRLLVRGLGADALSGGEGPDPLDA